MEINKTSAPDEAKLLVEKAWKLELALWQEKAEIANAVLITINETIEKFTNDRPVTTKKLGELKYTVALLTHVISHVFSPRHCNARQLDSRFDSILCFVEKRLQQFISDFDNNRKEH